jgi:hypothetical protein
MVLRHVPRGEVLQLLTERVASARDLPGVLTWRLGRVLTAARRDMARQVPADEDGARYAAMFAAAVTHRAPRPGPRSPPRGPSSRPSSGGARQQLFGRQQNREVRSRPPGACPLSHSPLQLPLNWTSDPPVSM